MINSTANGPFRFESLKIEVQDILSRFYVTAILCNEFNIFAILCSIELLNSQAYSAKYYGGLIQQLQISLNRCEDVIG